MSTWQQHVITNITTNHQGNTQNLNNPSKLVEISNELEEINHTSALSGDFGE